MLTEVQYTRGDPVGDKVTWPRITFTKIQLVPMGVLAPGSAHARLSARPPIDTSGNFSAHMSGGGKLSDSFSDQLSRQIREF